MDAVQVLQSDFLDLLFENRNKDYGAYDLRKKYNQRIGSALTVTGLIAVGIFTASFFANAFSSKGKASIDAGDVVVRTIEEQKPPPVQPPPPKVEPPPQVQTTRLTTMVIREDVDVKKEELPPVNEIERVDVVSREGVADDGRVSLPPVDNGSGVVQTAKAQEETDEPFMKVEIEARVNMNQWKRWLENQLQRYVEDAAGAGMTAGQYTVQVRFVVERDGSITEVKALNDPGYGLAKGAELVVLKGPKWTAGEQNGRKVRSYHTQPISFLIEN
jgi:periplasmic protein TonB